MKLRNYLKKTALAIGFTAVAAASANAATLRVGYWTSGISLGFGAVLEAQKFFQKQGFDVQFVHFPDVNGPTKAIAANAIDLAFGASLAGAYSLAAQGVPIKVILATQTVEAEFVVLADSPIKSIKEFRGKKVGMSPIGSATTGVGTAVLESNHGIDLKDFNLVPGNESRLVQFLMQKDVDAAVLRTMTVAQIADSNSKLRVLGTFADEWAKMTKSPSPPYIGVAIVRNEWLEKNPATAAKAVLAMRQALEFGASNKSAVVDILKKAANMPEDGAKFYADVWTKSNAVTLEERDIATLKRTFEIFKADGTLKGDLPADLFYTKPYTDSKVLK
jgi:ABC-type nitrate/sulfonate/bicarbonate transport system substrate-binding protein